MAVGHFLRSPWTVLGTDVKVIEDDPAASREEANGTSETYESRAMRTTWASTCERRRPIATGMVTMIPYTEDLDESEDTARMTSDNPVQMADYENTAPTFPDQDPDMEGVQNETATRSIAENTAQGTDVGAPVVATDIGADGSQEVLTYTLAGTDASSFTINERTGQISVGTTLDYEDVTKPDHEYVVTVTAADPTDELAPLDRQSRATITVTIEVTDVDEDPTISDAARTSINFNENAHEPKSQHYRWRRIHGDRPRGH